MLRHFDATVFLLLISEVFLLLFFPPSLLVEPNIPSGGDTPSHFIAALAMREKLASPFSPVTWFHGCFAGHPLFLQYFPLPFYLMALLSLAIPLETAFKLVTLLAVIPLPASVCYALRKLGYRGIIPGIGAVLSLSFLFMTENSMWGGNLNSTLAGEFSFGISFTLSIVLAGRLYSDAFTGKSLFKNGLLEACMALCSGYPLLQAGTGTSFFALHGKLRYLLGLHAAAFGFAGFWLLPLLWRMPYNSPFAHFWNFQSPAEIFPPILWPAGAGALFLLARSCRNVLRLGPSGMLSSLRSSRGKTPEQYLWYQFGISLLLFSLAPTFGLVDIRFLPFAQIFVVMLGAIGWGEIFMRLPRPVVWAAVLGAATIAFAIVKAPAIDTWIQWNYSGLDAKSLKRPFLQVNGFLRGDANSPRVVDEHSEYVNGTGTVRAFEMLPYYSGRSTLEGLYMQSSLSAPFVFYIQSELSLNPSCPLVQYHYSRPDPQRAAAHLRLFNASQVVSMTEDLSNALEASPDFELEGYFPPFRVYRVANAPDSYVEPLAYRPFRISARHWRAVQFDWFRKSSLRVPLVLAEDNVPGEFMKSIPLYTGAPESIPEIPIGEPDKPVRAEARLEPNRIAITTSRPGHPLWIKVSHHPDWKVREGEGDLYPASPAFMLLVPKTPEVVLEFDTTGGVYMWGKLLSLLAVAVPATLWCRRRLRARARASGPGTSPHRRGPVFPANGAMLAVLALISGVTLACALTRIARDPVLLYESATRQVNTAAKTLRIGPENPPSDRSAPIIAAQPIIDACLKDFPGSSVFDHCIYYKSQVLLAERKYEEVSTLLDVYLTENPDTRILSESLTALGEAALNLGRTEEAVSFFRRSVLTWPENAATRQAGLRLAEMLGPEVVLGQARDRLESGDYLRAYTLLKALSLSADEDIRTRSTLSLGYCCYYMSRWEEASNLFLQWMADNFDSPESDEVQAAYRQCRIISTQKEEWLAGPDGIIPVQQAHGWFLRLLDRIGRAVRPGCVQDSSNGKEPGR